jgi:hypothetical protein
MDMVGFRNQLQSRAGDTIFQFRLQFADRKTDSNDKNNYLYWPPGQFPRMTIEYNA